MASFEEILNQPSGEIKPPEAYPVGTYHCLVDGAPEVRESSNKNKSFQFKLKILSALSDVDAQKVAEQQVVGKTILADFYVTDLAKWRLKEFLVDSLGIDDDGGKTPLIQLISAAPGKQVLVKLRHELSQDGKRNFHRVDSTAHV